LKNLLAFVHDAAEFVRYFGIAVTRSAPHIYVSALPFAPSSSLILKQYHPLFPRTLSLEYGRLFHWPALKMTIGSHDGLVSSIAFSPDGRRIASGSHDNTIRVWDAAIGEAVAGPFIGHTGPVNSVAFLPDGQRIASASQDGTIRVWNVATGEIVVGPFTIGYTSHVAFSPDGQHVASLFGWMIRVWDAATGELVTD
jgi:WD40 repeat protein